MTPIEEKSPRDKLIETSQLIVKYENRIKAIWSEPLSLSGKLEERDLEGKIELLKESEIIYMGQILGGFNNHEYED